MEFCIEFKLESGEALVHTIADFLPEIGRIIQIDRQRYIVLGQAHDYLSQSGKHVITPLIVRPVRAAMNESRQAVYG